MPVQGKTAHPEMLRRWGVSSLLIQKPIRVSFTQFKPTNASAIAAHIHSEIPGQGFMIAKVAINQAMHGPFRDCIQLLKGPFLRNTPHLKSAADGIGVCGDRQGGYLAESGGFRSIPIHIQGKNFKPVNASMRIIILKSVKITGRAEGWGCAVNIGRQQEIGLPGKTHKRGLFSSQHLLTVKRIRCVRTFTGSH